MWVSKLHLRNFRSYPALDLDLAPGVTTFVGPNGWGKTNLVEALAYISTLRSHRVSQDLPLVTTGQEQANVALLAHRGQRQIALDVTIKAKGANRARINRQPVRSRELVGLLPTVVFAPEDLGLVKGEPAERRDFLDQLLVTLSPRYVAVLADFERALKQRNALLKNLKNNPDPALESTLSIWDQAFAQAAAQLVLGRRQLVERLAAPLAENFATLAAEANENRQSAQAEYVSRIDYAGLSEAAEYEAAIVAALERRRAAEIERGLTLAGPQRDDLELRIGSTSAKNYASHGESWSLALALRLSGWAVLQAQALGAEDSAVLVLDDVFAELDEGRRRRLGEMVSHAEQVLITAAVAGDVPHDLRGTIVNLPEVTAAAAAASADDGAGSSAGGLSHANLTPKSSSPTLAEGESDD